MSRKNPATMLTQITILLLAGCEVASPDSPEASVVVQQGLDPILVIGLLVLAIAAGWIAHKKLRGGE